MEVPHVPSDRLNSEPSFHNPCANRGRDHWFRAGFDTYKENSGSLVVSSEGVAEGIHVRGGTAFVETDEGCFVSLVCPDPGTLPAPLGCMGSDEQRTIDLSPFVPLLPGENPTSI